jgi:hypothetical protein
MMGDAPDSGSKADGTGPPRPTDTSYCSTYMRLDPTQYFLYLFAMIHRRSQIELLLVTKALERSANIFGNKELGPIGVYSTVKNMLALKSLLIRQDKDDGLL